MGYNKTMQDAMAFSTKKEKLKEEVERMASTQEDMTIEIDEYASKCTHAVAELKKIKEQDEILTKHEDELNIWIPKIEKLKLQVKGAEMKEMEVKELKLTLIKTSGQAGILEA